MIKNLPNSIFQVQIRTIITRRKRKIIPAGLFALKTTLTVSDMNLNFLEFYLLPSTRSDIRILYLSCVVIPTYFFRPDIKFLLISSLRFLYLSCFLFNYP